MPKLLSFQDTKPMHFSPERSGSPHRQWSWKKWFGKDSSALPLEKGQVEDPMDDVRRRQTKKAIPSLPRSGTFKRQQSELRENLELVKPFPHERRAFSVNPHRGESLRESSRASVPSLPRTSAPGLLGISDSTGFAQQEPEAIIEAAKPEPLVEDIAEPPPLFNDVFDDDLEEELEKRWILNLSMHFRDRSNREKFFVTFAETPTHWRRVTVSVDYRDASPNSLELELQHTQYQRDKSAKIYEAIRDSLLDIQFYETVTNLKLATENDRLHVHVTEDVNEVIHFPPISAIGHLRCRRVKERDVEFDSHLSGFVYKVNVGGQVFIKKEIPGLDTVEEFLYEVNALHRLSDSESVIRFGGVITDNEGRHLKGLLISYAEQGALIDVLYDGRGQLSWPRRERWAKQIVQGLSEIHEAGFVQGDFTLSNIVIDGDDKAKIIDINRRGCPVGWEPPEVAALIESKQRIAMYIGVKSDVFQLGMVLWAIAMQQDEPDIQPWPLTLTSAPEEIPSYYRDLVHICLSDDPKDRRNTSYLLDLFPDLTNGPRLAPDDTESYTGEHQYIDPATAVNREDIERFRRLASPAAEHPNMDFISTGSHTYVNPPTDISGEAYFFPTRGRSSPRLPVGETEYHQSSNVGHVSHVNTGQGGDFEDLASPDGEPIVVDVSPERHYRDDKVGGTTINVACAAASKTPAAEASVDDDDIVVDMNDAVRQSFEEYRQRHQELEASPVASELLSNQVYQRPVEASTQRPYGAEHVAYITPQRSSAAEDFDLQQSYAEKGETTYFDPTMTVDEQQDYSAQDLAAPSALCEENDSVATPVGVVESAHPLSDSTEAMLQQEHVAPTSSDPELSTSVPADSRVSTIHIGAAQEFATESDTQHPRTKVVATLPAAAEEPTPSKTDEELICQEDTIESLSCGWVEEAVPRDTGVGLTQTQLGQTGQPAPQDVQESSFKAVTAEANFMTETRAAQSAPEEAQISFAQVDKHEPAWEPKTFTVDTMDDYQMKPVDGRVDSGFAIHSDPEVPQYEKPVI